MFGRVRSCGAVSLKERSAVNREIFNKCFSIKRQKELDFDFCPTERVSERTRVCGLRPDELCRLQQRRVSVDFWRSLLRWQRQNGLWKQTESEDDYTMKSAAHRDTVRMSLAHSFYARFRMNVCCARSQTNLPIHWLSNFHRIASNASGIPFTSSTNRQRDSPE